jgi:hypothetical protein
MSPIEVVNSASVTELIGQKKWFTGMIVPEVAKCIREQNLSS